MQLRFKHTYVAVLVAIMATMGVPHAHGHHGTVWCTFCGCRAVPVGKKVSEEITAEHCKWVECAEKDYSSDLMARPWPVAVADTCSAGCLVS